jgi:hypothetical protein
MLGQGSLEMEYPHFSYEEPTGLRTARSTKIVILVDMKYGIRVRIMGHSDVADTVEFTMRIAEKAATAGGHRAAGNTQNAATYFDRGSPSKRRAIWTEQWQTTIRLSSSIANSVEQCIESKHLDFKAPHLCWPSYHRSCGSGTN